MTRRARKRPNPERCSCGCDYRDLRTGMTYKEVRRSMDPDRWKGRRRSSVLGYWREMKLGLWDEIHRSCEESAESTEKIYGSEIAGRAIRPRSTISRRVAAAG